MKFTEKNWLLVVIMAGVMSCTLAVFLSVGQSIWFDEGYSILLARQNFGQLLALTAVDAHPPFYYLVLKVWGDAFGFSEFSLRGLSALLLGAAVSVALLLTKRLFGIRTALVAIPILLLAPFLLRYGYEVRMYALATLIGVTATYVLVRARAASKTYNAWWLAYAGLVALGMYTLYMTAALWVTHFVWLVWVSLRHKVPLLQWRWIFAYMSSVVFFTPYIPTFFSQMTNSALPGMGNSVTLPVLADVISVLTVFTPGWQINGWLTLPVVALIAILVILSVRVFQRAEGKVRDGLLLYICLAGIPLLFFALTSLPPREPIFVIRYMAHVSIWVYLLSAVIIVRAWLDGARRLAAACALLLLIVLGVGVYNLADRGNYIFERVQTPETRALRSSIQCDDKTVIVADDPYTYIDAAFYFQDCDMRFYEKNNLKMKGGYAPLHDSTVRLAVSTDLVQPTVVHLHWGGPRLMVDDRYRRVGSAVYGKQHMDVYRLIVE